uniref:Uncharacterized protein n=1 Tax=Timema poppense TaxID=170557 RepID=A0A7R9DU70_TIMPO|nr:unnamed protein product [Timema poppensis]
MENGVDQLKRSIKRDNLAGKDVHMALTEFLKYYRNIPQLTTGGVPAMLMMGRALRTALDVIKIRMDGQNNQSMEEIRAHATRMNSQPQTASSAPAAGETAPGWVRFEEEGGRAPSNMESPSTQAPEGKEEYNGAVIKPETVHLNLNRSMSHSVSLEQSSTPPSTVFRGVPGDSPEVTTSTTPGKPPAMRSVNLNDAVNGRPTNTGRVSTHGGAIVRQGFGE